LVVALRAEAAWLVARDKSSTLGPAGAGMGTNQYVVSGDDVRNGRVHVPLRGRGHPMCHRFLSGRLPNVLHRRRELSLRELSRRMHDGMRRPAL